MASPVPLDALVFLPKLTVESQMGFVRYFKGIYITRTQSILEILLQLSAGGTGATATANGHHSVLILLHAIELVAFPLSHKGEERLCIMFHHDLLVLVAREGAVGDEAGAWSHLREISGKCKIKAEEMPGRNLVVAMLLLLLLLLRRCDEDC